MSTGIIVKIGNEKYQIGGKSEAEAGTGYDAIFKATVIGTTTIGNIVMPKYEYSVLKGDQGTCLEKVKNGDFLSAVLIVDKPITSESGNTVLKRPYICYKALVEPDDDTGGDYLSLWFNELPTFWYADGTIGSFGLPVIGPVPSGPNF